MRHELKHLSNDEIVHLAEQYIHHRVYRQMFIDRYCDGYTLNEIAERYQYEYRYTQHLMRDCMRDVIVHVKGES